MTWKRSDLTTDDVLRIVGQFGIGAWEELVIGWGIPAKVARACLERDVTNGLLSYGVCVERPWLTEQGRARLSKAAPAEMPS